MAQRSDIPKFSYNKKIKIKSKTLYLKDNKGDRGDIRQSSQNIKLHTNDLEENNKYSETSNELVEKSNKSSENDDPIISPPIIRQKKREKMIGRRKDVIDNYKLNKKKNQESESEIMNQENEDIEITFRQRLAKFLEVDNRLFYIKLIINGVSTLSFIYYFIATYVHKLYKSLNYIDYFVCSLNIIEHILSFLLAHHSLFYLISLENIINLFLEIPPFFSGICQNYELDTLYRFINISRVLRLLRTYRMIDILQTGEKSVKTQIFHIITILLIEILIWGGVIQILELGELDYKMKTTVNVFSLNNLKLRMQYHHYAYFVLCSLTTVGYGEIVPGSILGQMMVVVLVLVVLVLLPDQTNELINLINTQSVYEKRNYIGSKDIPYVLLIGDIKIDSLRSFCKEYFHSDHGNYLRHIVILMNKYPNKYFENFLNEENNQEYIFYLQGDPMNSEDLLRCDISNAKSCIIFTDKNSQDPYSSDQQSLLLGIFVKKFFYHSMVEKYSELTVSEILKLSGNNSIQAVNKAKTNGILKNNNFKICLQLNKPESSYYYYTTLQSIYTSKMLPDQLLIIETLKMNLLSKSCITPGIISLISNLVMSSSSVENLTKTDPEWIKEYLEGQQYEIYKIHIENELLSYTYQMLCLEIYNKFHSILFALEVGYDKGSLIKLNPQCYNMTLNEIIDQAAINLDNTINVPSVNGNDENEFHLISKKNIGLKLRTQIIINLYIISSGKEMIEEIIKMDNPKYLQIFTRQSSKFGFSRQNTNILNLEKRASSRRNSKFFFSQINNKICQKSPIVKSKFGKQSNNLFLDSSYNSDTENSDECNEKKKNSLFDFNKDILHETNDNEVENNNKIQSSEEENYYILENNQKNKYLSPEIVLNGIKDNTEIEHHIVICGVHPEIIHFILPLRARYLPEKILKWIVILAPNMPSEIFKNLLKYPKIVYVQGDPLIPDNLYKANIVMADIVVIINNNFVERNNKNCKLENDIQNKRKNKNYTNIDEVVYDSNTIFIYKSVKKINKNIQIITELMNSQNIEFLLSPKYICNLQSYSEKTDDFNKKNNEQSSFSSIFGSNNVINSSNLNYEHTPVYAAGEIYLPSLIERITCQIFYNNNLLNMVNLLLTGEIKSNKKEDKKLREIFDLKGTNLFLLPCENRKESYEDLFKRLVSKYNIMSIGLYRKNNANNIYYVYTNPKKTTLIRETDYVFVLSSTENILLIQEKNLLNLNEQKNMLNFTNNFREHTSYFNKLSIITNNDSNNNRNNYRKLNINNDLKRENSSRDYEIIQDAIQNKISKNEVYFNSKTNNSKVMRSSEKRKTNFLLNIIKQALKNENPDEEIKRAKGENEENNIIFNTDKFKELDYIQKKVNHIIDRLKLILASCHSFNNDVANMVKNELKNELSVYINKTFQK